MPLVLLHIFVIDLLEMLTSALNCTPITTNTDEIRSNNSESSLPMAQCCDRTGVHDTPNSTSLRTLENPVITKQNGQQARKGMCICWKKL